jgi:hypothetical protein
LIDFPPANNAAMALPAGGQVTVQLSGNVALTDLGPKGAGVVWPGGARGHSVLFMSY